MEGATRLLTDEAYRSATAANARRLAERMFSVGAVVDEIELLYRSLVTIQVPGVLARGGGGRA